MPTILWEGKPTNIRSNLLSASLCAGSLAALQATLPQSVHRPAAVQHRPPPASAAYDFDMDVFHPVVASNGMVASEQELASRIGLDILKPAATPSMPLALALRWPWFCPTPATRRRRFHDGARREDGKSRGAGSPRSGAPNHTARHVPGRPGQGDRWQSLYTHYAVGVPGTVAAWSMPEGWGTMPLSKVIAAAIALAGQGLPGQRNAGQDPAARKRRTWASWSATQAIF